MKDYLKLARVKHYLKNILIAIPLFFSGMVFEEKNILTILFGFLTFSFICSIIYIINDIRDVEKDKLHEVKRKRPIASGKISKKKAIIFAIILGILSISIETIFIGFSNYNYIFLIAYFILNLGYSFGLKDIPLLDVIILVSGFVLRIAYGGAIFDISVSNWLYLTVFAISFYLAFGKRRNEILKSNGQTRKVLSYYSKDFLDKNMYLFLTIAIIFYSLWCVDPITVNNTKNMMIFTVPLVIIICLRYSMIIETDGYGDPVDVVFSDKLLIFLGILYIGFLSILLYIV